MKVLLQDIDTLNFVRADLGWTAFAEEAFDFGEVVQAVDYAIRHQHCNLRPIIKFQGLRSDVRLVPVHWTAA